MCIILQAEICQFANSQTDIHNINYQVFVIDVKNFLFFDFFGMSMRAEQGIGMTFGFEYERLNCSVYPMQVRMLFKIISFLNVSGFSEQTVDTIYDTMIYYMRCDELRKVLKSYDVQMVKEVRETEESHEND